MFRYQSGLLCADGSLLSDPLSFSGFKYLQWFSVLMEAVGFIQCQCSCLVTLSVNQQQQKQHRHSFISSSFVLKHLAFCCFWFNKELWWHLDGQIQQISFFSCYFTAAPTISICLLLKNLRFNMTQYHSLLRNPQSWLLQRGEDNIYHAVQKTLTTATSHATSLKPKHLSELKPQ